MSTVVVCLSDKTGGAVARQAHARLCHAFSSYVYCGQFNGVVKKLLFIKRLFQIPKQFIVKNWRPQFGGPLKPSVLRQHSLHSAQMASYYK